MPDFTRDYGYTLPIHSTRHDLKPWGYREDPHPDALARNGGPQCESKDGVYCCTLTAGHAGDVHHTWDTCEGTQVREWSTHTPKDTP